MLRLTINKYLEQPEWLSTQPTINQPTVGVVFPWLIDKRLINYLKNNYRMAAAMPVKEADSFGHYHLHGLDIDNDGRLDFLVILDESGMIIENFIFSLHDNNLDEELIVVRIKNREQKILDDLFRQLGLVKNETNIKLLKELLNWWKVNIFTRSITQAELKLFRFLLDFGLNYFKTDDRLDLRKVNFVLERLNNPWSVAEIRAILQLLDDYRYLRTIKEAELIFERLGGIKNTGLVIHKGRYHKHLISLVRNFDLPQKTLLESLDEMKRVMIRLEN